MPHITQIAATDVETGTSFNCYVIPKVPLTSAAQDITGIVVNQSGTMTVKGKPVQGKTIQSAISEFILWLTKFPCAVLVAHNGRRFDFPVLLSTLRNIGCVDKLFDCVTGFIDSLTVFKKAYPDQESYKQEHLVQSILKFSYAAHDAIEDVTSLGKLLTHTGLATADIMKHSYPPSAVYNSLLFSEAKSNNINSLLPLVFNGVMKRPTAENIAGSGLKLNDLRKIFERSGEDGLRDIFVCANSEGLPRVTNAKRTLDGVLPKLADFLSK